MDDLVAQIKDLQRNEPGAKEQWWAYCDALGQGVHDPAKHPSSFVQTFIDNHKAGQRFEAATPTGGGGGGADPHMLALLCKEGQRKSPHWKTTWAQYCMSYGGGRNDPEKHDMSFLVGFLDYVGQRGMMALTAGGASLADLGGPAAKRARTGPAGPAGPSARGYFNAPEKDGLVARLKAFQRSSEEAKELWGSYCDQHLGGVRDPARHDSATLQQFCANNNVP
eukprot:CAMPEP_0171107430 /NCGR_PEP_ID=MMETSP0766_2-20121228/66797_1 /TAXON_ID=439317 /ORGANISM="Gambierdiscus australes, Strain CAWD 149" /LENGTH=222 /DNA_ID=CAMNT_0011568731 /DNA_START=76 /DNA_END=744 /DNA_ORIENTATION=-